MIGALVREELATLAPYAVPHPGGIQAKLDANESPHALPPAIAQALGAHLATVALHRYPDGHATDLRQVLAREVGAEPAALVPGNGSDELIALLLDTFARPRAGQDRPRALWPAPSFVYYRIGALGRGVVPVEVPLRPDFTLDLDAVEEAFARERPNVAFFALPNNPTGTLWPRAVLVTLLERHPDTLIVADEAYVAYSGETHLDLLPRFPNLVVMRTLSKTGLAALRVGYMVAHPDVVAAVERIRPPYNVGSLAQAAAAWLLAHHGELLAAQARAVVDERERVAGALRAAGVHVFPARANFVLLRVDDATAVWQRLAARGVLVRNFDRPGPLAGCLRVTIGTRAENELFLRALLE
jgi:histidinol-phosphate aminotransferase